MSILKNIRCLSAFKLLLAVIYLAFFCSGVTCRFYQLSSRQVLMSGAETVEHQVGLQHILTKHDEKTKGSIFLSLDKRYDLKYFVSLAVISQALFFFPQSIDHVCSGLPYDILSPNVAPTSLRGPPIWI